MQKNVIVAIFFIFIILIISGCASTPQEAKEQTPTSAPPPFPEDNSDSADNVQEAGSISPPAFPN